MTGAVRRIGGVVRTPMRVRIGGREVPLDRARLVVPGATAYLVVLVPGRDGGTDWWSPGEGTEVWVRYDAARDVAESGRELAGVLSRLLAAWPVQVERVVVVGHSTGGLVARSAVRQPVGSAERPGLSLVSEVVCLATASAGDIRAWALRDTTARADRASGELRHGYLDEHDWQRIEPGDLLAGRLAVRPAGHLAGRAGRAGRGAGGSRAGYWVGDLLVVPEAAERGLFGRLRERVRRAWLRFDA